MIMNPQDFKMEKTTVWSFKERGNWCTHNGNYRGNFSPYVPRNIILKYSKEKDWVLDLFCGSGTTLIESKLLNRNSIGIDVNIKAIDIARKNLDFDALNEAKVYLFNEDARYINKIKDNSINLICTHPPYANIIKYSENNENDLSLLNIDDFLESMELVAKESYRVIKNRGYCCFLIGDIRHEGTVFPLGFKLMNIFISQGFVLKEIVIKEQHNCRGDSYWNSRIYKTDYYLLAHEYMFVLIKK